MTTIYKFKALFEVTEYDELEDEDYWADETDRVTVHADSLESAEAKALNQLKEDYSVIRHATLELLEAIECPADKFLLTRNLVSKCGRYISDGYVMIEIDLGFSPEPVENEFDNPFPDYEERLGEPLGDYAITTKETAVFEAGLLWAKFVQDLNRIGVVICSVECGSWSEPFALAKDGRYVGVVMPIFGTRECDHLDTAEKRRSFIDAQYPDGVYRQIEK